MIPPVFSLVWSFAIIFVVCEFGQQLTHQFVLFDEELCQFNWYLLPIELQRMLVIIMANAQQASFMQGYGNIQCTRGSFKQVRDNVSFMKKKNILFYLISFIYRQSMPHFLISWYYAMLMDRKFRFSRTMTTIEWKTFCT